MGLTGLFTTLSSPAEFTTLEEIVLAVNASNITFDNIPATHRDLKLVVAGAITFGSGIADFCVRFNPTDPDYTWTVVTDGVAALDTGGDNKIKICTPKAINAPFRSVIEIPNYVSTILDKGLVANSSCEGLGEFDAVASVQAAGKWDHTEAIHTVQLNTDPATFSFVAGTVATLYGLGAI